MSVHPTIAASACFSSHEQEHPRVCPDDSGWDPSRTVPSTQPAVGPGQVQSESCSDPCSPDFHVTPWSCLRFFRSR